MTTGQSSIRVVAEEPADELLSASAPAPVAPRTMPDPRVDSAIAAIRTLDGIVGKNNARLAALEIVAQQLPQVAGMVSALLRALGARVLALLGLIGCLALAFVVALNPQWQALVILAIVVFGVQLPLVLVAYLKRD